MKDYTIISNYYSVYVGYFDVKQLELYSIHLTHEEKNRLTSIPSDKRKLEFASVRYLLKKYLGNYTINYTDLGAPYINLGPSISISHSHDVALIAKTEKNNIGVDIEKIQERTTKLASKFMNNSEIIHLKNEDKELNEITYTKIWCCKEAIFKLFSGDSISIKENITIRLESSKTAIAKVNIKNIEYSISIDIHYLDNYIIAVAVN